MNNNVNLLTEKERSDYGSLAIALGITLEELLQLEFYNQDIFDEGGVAKEVKYFFNENNPHIILSKIKGLNAQYSIILSTKNLNYY